MSPKPVQMLVKPKSELGFMQCMKKLYDDMTMLYETGKHSDLKIICKGVEFPVHRAILFPRSDFFRACCDPAFKEGQENVVILPDDDPIAMKMALREIYTRCPSVVKDHYNQSNDAKFDTLIQTWKLADKYQLPDLTMQCIHFIDNTLNADLLRVRSGDKWAEDLVRGLSESKGLDLGKEGHLNCKMRDVISSLLLQSIHASGIGVREEALLKDDPEVSVGFLKYMAQRYWEIKSNPAEITQMTNGSKGQAFNIHNPT